MGSGTLGSSFSLSIYPVAEILIPLPPGRRQRPISGRTSSIRIPHLRNEQQLPPAVAHPELEQCAIGNPTSKALRKERTAGRNGKHVSEC
jgi:hypothetical protein